MPLKLRWFARLIKGGLEPPRVTDGIKTTQTQTPVSLDSLYGTLGIS